MRYLFLRRPLGLRFDAEAFGFALREHMGRFGLAYLLLMLAALLFQSFFGVGWNVSSSLPHRVYVFHKGALPERGQYVAFRWTGGGTHPTGITFVKIIAGVPGDTVTQIGLDFFVNGNRVGTAKVVSLTGMPLEAGPTGVIPPGHFYVQAPHPDSLDSRYRLTGWVSEAQIIGRAYVLF